MVRVRVRVTVRLILALALALALALILTLTLTLTLTPTLALTCPCSCAVCSAVCPRWLSGAGEAPCASSSEISGAWPWAAAACSGVSRPAPRTAAPG